MKGYLKYLFFVLVILFIILWLAGIFKFKVKSGEIKPETKVISGIKTALVEKQEVTEVSYMGEVISQERAEIATKFTGRVISVKIKEGDCIKAGTPLITLDAEELYAQIQALKHQVKQAEADYRSKISQLTLAQTTYERYFKLYQENAVTPQEFDEVKARYDSVKEALIQAEEALLSVKSQLQALSSQLKYVKLTAPFSGCIVEKKVDLGDLALPGQPLIIMEKGPLQVKAELPEKYFEKIKKGDILEIEREDTGDRRKGKVVEKSSAIDPHTKTFKIKLSLENPSNLKSGTLVKVLVPEKLSILLVPEKALFQKYDFTGVFVVKPDRIIELRYVKTGLKRKDKVEILSGVKEGEEVVVEGLEKACDGCRLE